MINLKKYLYLFIALCLPLGFVACSDSDEPLKPAVRPGDGEEVKGEKAYQDEEAYANFFGFNVMSDYYLWNKEIKNALSEWKIMEDPIEAVENYRYKDTQGQDIDKWTMMTDKYTEMVGSTDGVSTGTFGCNYKFYLKEEGSDAVVAFVTFTYPDSPAEKAGLKRGDVVLSLNGKPLDRNNYTDLYYSSSIKIGVGHFNGDGTYSSVEKNVAMQSKAMYEDPILKHDVFNCGGKKVGYLAYTSFTFESSLGLYEVCKEFKKQGIEELILDLRYNGGGYVFTEEVLASMLAPEAEVKAKSIFQTEIWNDDYMAYYEQEGVDLNTYFSTEFKQKHNDKLYDFNTSDANLGLTKIYALVTESSASASEAILVGLMPYMDIEIIGQPTHGKYCAGIMVKGEEWYQDLVDMYKANKLNFARQYPEFADWKKHIADWGIYVMISMYTDKDGKNPCMPNGLTPHVTAKDMIEEPYPLGDEREALLNLALQRAGKTDLEPRPKSRSAGVTLPSDRMLPGKKSPLDGKLIHTGIRLSPLVQEMK
jgi:C-terminal processing protease CtpA/Prc